ncbi:MAG: hypothetical protein CSA38_02645 [Flavobacteriales bacterium]|nr:MAG: hypothetical protein CSA38_02645 [Flavobacteriales bacterium]
MRPEKKAPSIELNDNEKAILDLLTEEHQPLMDIKEKAGLSNKKWDKSTKNLSKNNLIKVEKIDDVVVVKKL